MSDVDNNVIYEDAYLRITSEDEAENQSEIDIGEIQGEKVRLLGFNKVIDDEGNPLLAYKIRADKPLALYYVWPGGDEAFRDFEEAVSSEFPDYEIADVRRFINHHAAVEKMYRARG